MTGAPDLSTIKSFTLSSTIHEVVIIFQYRCMLNGKLISLLKTNL